MPATAEAVRVDTQLECRCGCNAPEDETLPFRCARANTGGDHVLRRVIAATDVLPEGWMSIFMDDEPNPFVRYRSLLLSHAAAMRAGMTDSEYVSLVRHLDAKVAAVDGIGFAETPLRFAGNLRKSAIVIKDETANVSGSHKARHLFGVLLWMEVARATGLLRTWPVRLAIASCGNAALAAATVARAADLPLSVFVPTDAHPRVVARLRELDAIVTLCERATGVNGDPAMHAFRASVARGAVPFGVQGNENGLALEGGLTLGYELVSELLREKRVVDRLFIQVGGGALASSCVQALQECVSFGLLPRMPRVHAVQTRGAYPLARAFGRVKSLVEERHLTIAEALAYAREHREAFMWPWESVPHSIAHGILDDETYDWLAVVEGMLHSGGSPVVVSEEELREANRIGCDVVGIDADATGSAGLAGLLQLEDARAIHRGEQAAVLFTGRRR